MSHTKIDRERENIQNLEILLRQFWERGGPQERRLQVEVALWRAKQRVGQVEHAVEKSARPTS